MVLPRLLQQLLDDDYYGHYHLDTEHEGYGYYYHSHVYNDDRHFEWANHPWLADSTESMEQDDPLVGTDGEKEDYPLFSGPPQNEDSLSRVTDPSALGTAAHEDHSGHDHGANVDPVVSSASGATTHEDHSGHGAHDFSSAHEDHSGHAHGNENPFVGTLGVVAAHEDHSGHDHSGHFYGNETLGFAVSSKSIERNVPWGSIVAASAVVQAVTLSGLLLVAGMVVYNRMRRRRGDSASQVDLHTSKFTQTLIPAFASGALLATVVFLLIPEAVLLLEEVHGAAAWKFGLSFFGGFLFPVLLGIVFPAPNLEDLETRTIISGRSEREDVEEDEEEEPLRVTSIEEAEADEEQEGGFSSSGDEYCEDEENDANDTGTQKSRVIPAEEEPVDHNMRLALSILVGDFLHNFCDGIFLGTAFMLCSSSLAWTMTVATIYHELAQEIADFTLLTGFCNFTVCRALTFNFISGFATIIGAMLVAAVEMSNSVIGVILSISAGVYVYIAVAECLPKLDKDRLAALTCFLLGAVPIGLVLLNHNHCGFSDDGEDHSGHNH